MVLMILCASLWGFNHPEIEWRSVTTDHFIINFYDRTEEAVYPAWRIAEEAYESLADLYGYEMRDKISLSIADYDDYSNGFAEWTMSNIMVWLPDSRFVLRSNTTWLRNVITHELAHIISLESRRRRQLIDITLQFTISGDGEQYGFAEPFERVTLYPVWLAEGIAQIESENLGNDCFDSRREMVLRDAILSNYQLTLDEMGNFNHDHIGSEAVYNQGYAFTKYLAANVGMDMLRAVMSDGSNGRIDFYDAFEERTGRSLDNLYNFWVDSLRGAFSKRRASIGATAMDTIFASGSYNLRPGQSPDGKYRAWLSSGQDDGDRTDLVIIRSDDPAQKVVRRIAWAHTAFCFSAESDKIYYIKSRRPNGQGSFYNDLFALDPGSGSGRRVTNDGRVYDVAAIPGSSDLLCVCFRDGAFGLYRCSVSGGELAEVVPGEAGSPIVNVCVNPQDSSQIAVSKIVSGRSRIFMVDRNNRVLVPVTSGAAQEESPFWAKDGRIYFSADYDGVFNIYSVKPGNDPLLRHSSCCGGLFSPHVGSDGTISASYYGSRRFSIVSFTPMSVQYEIPSQYRCSFGELPRPQGVVRIKSRSYEPDLRRSSSELLIGGGVVKNGSLLLNQSEPWEDSTSIVIALGWSKYRSDALHKRVRMASLQLGAQIITGEDKYSPYSNYETRSRLSGQSRKFVPEPFTRKFSNDRPLGFSATELSKKFQCENLFLRQSHLRRSMSYEEDDSTKGVAFGAYLLPSIMLENNASAPTLGLEMSAELQALFIPSVINITPYAELQLGRDLFAGVRLQATLAPLYGYPLFGLIPFYLTWSRYDRYNEDMTYNMADYSYVQFLAGPRFIPSLITDDESVDDYDTSYAPVVNGVQVGLELFHAFPLFKYGSFQLSSSNAATYHNRATVDDGLASSSRLIDGVSKAYVLSSNGARLTFPILRNINRGRRTHYDALYGTVGYTLFGYVNSGFFDRLDQLDWKLLSDEYFLEQWAFADQIVSIGCDLGNYKSYQFFRTVSFSLSYQIVRKVFQVSLTSGL